MVGGAEGNGGGAWCHYVRNVSWLTLPASLLALPLTGLGKTLTSNICAFLSSISVSFTALPPLLRSRTCLPPFRLAFGLNSSPSMSWMLSYSCSSSWFSASYSLDALFALVLLLAIGWTEYVTKVPPRIRLVENAFQCFTAAIKNLSLLGNSKSYRITKHQHHDMSSFQLNSLEYGRLCFDFILVLCETTLNCTRLFRSK